MKQYTIILNEEELDYLKVLVDETVTSNNNLLININSGGSGMFAPICRAISQSNGIQMALNEAVELK